MPPGPRRPCDGWTPLLPELQGGPEQAEARLRALADELGMKLGDMLMPLRVAVTGSQGLPAALGEHPGDGRRAGAQARRKALAVLEEYAARS